MFRSTLMASALAALLAASCLGTIGAANAADYTETDLVVGGPDAKLVAGVPTLTDANGIVHNAQILDPDLVNAWGLTESTTVVGPPLVNGSPFWVSDNGSGKSTLYTVPPGSNPPTATKNARVVSIPSPGDPLGASGTPTGAAWNPTSRAAAASQEFKIPGYLFTGVGVAGNCSHTTAVASFLFDTEDGTIVGWNSNLYPTQALCNAATAAGQNNTAIIAVDNSAKGQGGGKGVGTGKGKGKGLGAVYKGLAIVTDPVSGATFLYATNFRRGTVEIYDGTFALLDTFTDKDAVKNGYAPFNVSAISGKLFVTFAVQGKEKTDDVAGPGNGIVDTFDLSGNNLQRFAQGGALNSPWGLVLAPAGFGNQGGKLWIGNFGDGKINAFPLAGGSSQPVNKSCVAPCTPQPIVIDGLWALSVGNDGNGGSSQKVYFTAGPNDEEDGLFGALSTP